MLMRKMFLFLVLCGSQTVFAEKNELGLTLGGLFPQDRGTAPNMVRLDGGTSLQANYGRRLIKGRPSLYGEIHFLANSQRTITSSNPASSRDVATIYLTPGIRLKFAEEGPVSPYFVVGGGYALYEQSLLQIDGRPNTAPRYLHRGAFDFGGGVDTRLWRWIGLRGEIRDFYTGSPAYNVPNVGGGQHNVVAGGGFVLKWGD